MSGPRARAQPNSRPGLLAPPSGVGKWITKIQVVRLDGHHLTWLESFERFVAYLHIPATLFIGLVDLWHDPNRRMGHDRAAHTAVLRK